MASLPADLASALDLSSDTPTTGPTPPDPSNSQTADQVLADMHKTPLFMSSLDEVSDPADNSNIELEAMKALAYEGTKAEVAANFKAQGNECVGLKLWTEARAFYDQGLGVLRGVGVRGRMELTDGEEEDERQIIDIEEEEKKEKLLEEQICVNRALCNLEMKNYRKTITDCTTALHLNPTNTKALYRTASAHHALDLLPAATAAINLASRLSPSDARIAALAAQISARAALLERKAATARDDEARRRKEAQTLALALKARRVRLQGRVDGAGNDMRDAGAVIRLEDAGDPGSGMLYPILLLYPTGAQSELLKGVLETQTLGLWLKEVFEEGLAWDAEGEFTLGGVECYMDTPAGGLVKVGKKVLLGEVLAGGKVVVKDGLVRVYVLPKGRVAAWIAEEKRRRGK